MIASVCSSMAFKHHTGDSLCLALCVAMTIMNCTVVSDKCFIITVMRSACPYSAVASICTAPFFQEVLL
jgi:hypothetical protein